MQVNMHKRTLGRYKGQIQIPDNFNDESEEIVNLFEIAQAEGLTIITCDNKFPPYKVRLIDAEK
jgi:hypothetical protein